MLLSTHTLAAQSGSTTGGWTLGGHLQASRVDPERFPATDGGGLGLEAAYGLNNGVSFFLTLAGATMRPDQFGAPDYVLSHGDLGVRYRFRTEAVRWRPYLEGALSGLAMTWEDVRIGDRERVDVEIRGGALSLGGGVEYFMNPRWALFGGVRWSSGSFQEVQIDQVTVRLDPSDEIDLFTSRLQIGVGYHFRGRGR
jgi:hypothetical protein